MKKKIIKIYIANPYGFTELGKILILYGFIIPRLQQIIHNLPSIVHDHFEFILIEPFEECNKELNLKFLNTLSLQKEHLAFWQVFCSKVGSINYAAIDAADIVLAILDWHDVGVGAEVGYAAKKGGTPIVGLMSDFRPSENMATNVNCMISKAIQMSRGRYIYGENCIVRWFNAVEIQIMETIIKLGQNVNLTEAVNNHLKKLVKKNF